MEPTAYNWFSRSAVDELREMIIIYSQKSRLESHTEELIEVWNLCSVFGLFYEENFEDSCEIKSTSIFSNESLVAQKEIEDHYREMILLVCLFQSNMCTPLASDLLAPSVINYLARKSPQSPNVRPSSTSGHN